MTAIRMVHLSSGRSGAVTPDAQAANLLLRAMRCALLCADMPAGFPLGLDCRAILVLLAIGGRRRLRMAPVDVDRPTAHELQLIAVIAAAQAGDEDCLDRHLETLVLPAWRAAVRAAVIDLAGSLLSLGAIVGDPAPDTEGWPEEAPSVRIEPLRARVGGPTSR